MFEFLYHNTARSNLPLIVESKRLDSAARLASNLGQTQVLSSTRAGPFLLSSRGPILQSQSPLCKKNIRFESGWTMDTLLARLNTLVFFWPGDALGPIKRGKDHSISKDGPNDPVTLRVPAMDAFKAHQPYFSKYNSGSPRWSHSKPSPRGPNTFMLFDEMKWAPSEIVEVVFQHSFQLPPTTEVNDGPETSFTLIT